MASSTPSCMACDCEMAVEGMRRASMTMFFSSSVGVNSWPSRVARAPASPRTTTAPPMKAKGVRTAPPSTGR